MERNILGLEQYGFVHVLILVIFMIMSVLILISIAKGLIEWIKFIKEDKEITNAANNSKQTKTNNN